MGRPLKLTKQDLMDLGVTEVTKDGRVFIGDIEMQPVIASKPSRYKVMHYRLINFYDKNQYRVKKAYRAVNSAGTRCFVLSRVIWAWHYGECPANMDVDHINDDSLDDRLENYQLLTRKENLAKRKYLANQ